MNTEPELLTREELLRIENIQLRRELLNQQDNALVVDIARARQLDPAEYSKTWLVNGDRIHRIVEEPVDA